MVMVMAVGCAGNRPDLPSLSDKRPPTNPAPKDVQQEMRDARFFLPLPDESIGPPTSLYTRPYGRPLSSGDPF